MYEEVKNEKYWLEEYIDLLTDITNRSERQTMELYNLVGKDIFKLIKLEQRLQGNYQSYMPTTKEEYDHCMNLPFNENSYKYEELNSLEYLWYYSKYHLFYPFLDYENPNFDYQKFQKMIASKITVPNLLGMKTFFMTSKTNNVSYYLKIGTEFEKETLDPEVNETALKLLQQAVQEDYHYRYQIVTDDYSEEHSVLDVLDNLYFKKHSLIRVLDYNRIEDIPENKQFFRVDHVYEKGYFGASGLFVCPKDVEKDKEESMKAAAKLILSQLIYTRPLVIKEDQLLDSVKEAVKETLRKQYEENNEFKKDIEKLEKKINQEYQKWLSTAVLYNQKLEFDYPDKKLRIKDFVEKYGIDIIRYISV